jgi:hypothetical protein
MMALKYLSCLAVAMSLLVAPEALAKKNKGSTSAKVTGVKCTQEPDSIVIGASEFKPNVRKSLRIGQRKKINIAGIGPIDCVVF